MSVIGYAYSTGEASIPVGPPHLHQAHYCYPSYRPDGSSYGGIGLQVIYRRYAGDTAGTGADVYTFDKSPGEVDQQLGPLKQKDRDATAPAPL